MKTITDINEMQQLCAETRRRGRRIAFVPTMGYLHRGHLSLLEEGRRRGDLLVLSIFVNPAQFGAGEDFDSYPRDLGRDAALAAEAGVDILFAPEAKAMYPRGYATFVDVEGISEGLCGGSRPGHFRGVATVVCKLFLIVQPHLALFGCKDFQQLAVIRRMTLDLNLPVQIIGMPIVREKDGLAMSSRNVYLSAEERRQALSLIDAIRLGAAQVAGGERDAAAIAQKVRGRLEREPDAVIDYVEIRQGVSLEPVSTVEADSVLLLAVRIGQTRLIDNHYLFRPI